MVQLVHATLIYDLGAISPTSDEVVLRDKVCGGVDWIWSETKRGIKKDYGRRRLMHG
jgi:hypothetical protein